MLTSGAGARPVQGFCASLGHRRDDETGLVYMRARYYDPQAGRFISEDQAMQGVNWFAYCDNDPVDKIDANGKLALFIIGAIIGGLISLVQTMVLESASSDPPSVRALKIISATLIGAAGGAIATFGPGASAAAAAIGSFLQSVVGDLCKGNGWGGVNWKKAAVAGGIGGTVGLAFGAIGASWGRNLQIADELREGFETMGGAVGDFTGSAVGNASGSALFPE